MLEHCNPKFNQAALVPVTVAHPKGSMCRVCKHVARDCSGLDFERMPSMAKYQNETNDIHFIIVKCNEFESGNAGG